MVHQFARKEIDDARAKLNVKEPETAAVFVENALADIEDFQETHYGPWQTRFTELVETFRTGVDRTETVVHREDTSFERRFDNQDAPSDRELLYLILDELEEIMDEMARLRDEFEAKYERRSGTAGDEQDGLSEDEFGDDEEFTCLRCDEYAISSDVRVFSIQDLPGERVICGRCVYQMTSLFDEDVSDSEALAYAAELDENRSDVRSVS